MVVERMLRGGLDALDDGEVLSLLRASGAEQEELFACARQVRRDDGGDGVVLRGVVEIGNVCAKNCEYCAMRVGNDGLSRYTLQPEVVVEVALAMERAGVSVIMLQSGQHPVYEALLETVIPVIRRETGVSLLLCVGEKRPDVYRRYRELGADSYILKFETSDLALYRQRAGTRLTRRLESLEHARAAGLRVGTGNIVGLPGQTPEALVRDVRLGVALRPDFVSSSPFVPNPGTPLEACPPGSVDVTLNTLALFRILLRRPLIPTVSALESLRPGGQLAGLRAGANVMTVNFTPCENRSLFRIYSDRRFVVSLEHALRTIERAGLAVRPGAKAPGSARASPET